MQKFHELVRVLGNFDAPSTPLYNRVVNAVKIDLGEAQDVYSLYASSANRFWDLPFSECLFQIHDDNGFYYYISWSEEGVTHWQCFAYSIPRNTWFKDHLHFTISSIEGLVKFTSLSGETIFSLLSGQPIEVFNTTFDRVPEKYKESIRAYLILASVIEVFSCSNVGFEDHPPPKFINSRRIKKGKIPFYTYKTIIIKESKRSKKTSNGTHASPRLHIRRGHIRTLPSGSKVWVRNCMVGDPTKGISNHDYKVTPKLSSKSM